MKLENQVCTLEQAKRLKELGVEQHSLCCYMAYGSEFIGNENPCLNNFYKADTNSFLWASAFTAAELIKMNAGNGGIDIGCTKESKGKFYIQTGGFGENKPEFTYYDSFAQASAAKLINALENEWLDVETCNSRLVE
jgi:hypothetical protein